MFRKKGWKSVVLNFVTTEFGEGAARSRCGLVAWRYEVVSEEVGKFVVRSATARPMATIVDSAKNSEALVWKRSRASQETGYCPRWWATFGWRRRMTEPTSMVWEDR